MTHRNVGAFVLLALLLLLGSPRAFAARDYGNCTGFIAAVPAVISTPGTWCVTQSLSTSMTGGSVISIETNNVTIDCNDFTLDGRSAGTGTYTVGIRSDSMFNATVRHCNLRGFYYGILLGGGVGDGHLVEDNRVDDDTYLGIAAYGDGTVIRRNRVSGTGGTANSADTYGIYAYKQVDVLDNTVTDVSGSNAVNGNTYGIYTTGSHGGIVNNNRVRGVLTHGTGIARAIYNGGSERQILRGNDVVGEGSGTSVGMSCDDSNTRARDNTIKGFATAISVCGDGGGNVIKP